MALMRIKKDLEEITNYPLVNCSVAPNDDLFNWDATLVGPENTVYEGGRFKLKIKFPACYPFKPPKVQFETKIYHPNIDDEGNICLDVLSVEWLSTMTISTVLISTGLLLNEPNAEDPLDPFIGAEYRLYKEKFERTARDFTRQYAK